MSATPSPATSSQTSTYTLSPEQQQLLNLAMPSLTQYAENPVKLPTQADLDATPAVGVAQFNPNQIAGQNQVLSAAPGQQGVVQSGAQASKLLTGGDLLYADSNPALQANIDAATRPITENLTEVQLPAIRNTATSVGQTGGSREGIAEGIALRGASDATADATAKLTSDAYNSGLSAMTQGLGLVPQTAGALTLPGQTTSAVGDVQQGQAQTNLSQSMAQFLYPQQEPLATGQALAGTVAGIPGGTTTSTGTTQASTPSTLSQIMGYGSIAAGAGSAASGMAALLPFLMA